MSAAPAVAIVSPEIAWRHWAMQAPHVELVSFPSRYLHPSWRAALGIPDIGEQVWNAPGSQAHLSRYIRRKLDLPVPRTPDISHPAWEIALLPADDLLSLVRHIGVVAAGGDIRSAIGKQDIRVIVEQIGQDLYDFGLERAGLICEHVPGHALPRDTTGNLNELGAYLQQTGRRIIGQYLDSCDPALWPRARLKLEVEPTLPEPAAYPDITDTLVARLVLRTQRELH